MKQSLLLNQYRYSIPVSSVMLPAMTKKNNKAYSEQRALLKVAFDFENGHLKLEGDWQFMMGANKFSEAVWFTYHKDRVFIDAAIYPAEPVNLYDFRSDGLTLSVLGSIDDGEILGSCSGLLTVEKLRLRHGPQWVISCYLCDLQVAQCEIKLQVPLYVTS